MQWLKIRLNSSNKAKQFHNIKLDKTEKKIKKHQNDFKFLLNNNQEIKKLSYLQNKLEGRGRNDTTITKQEHLERATRDYIRLFFVSPTVITVKKDQSVKMHLSTEN